MANPYPADVADSGGNVRLSGAITFTDADNQPGGGTLPSGATSPVEAVTPTGIGALYVDTTNGTLYIATGTADTDWTIVGGVVAGDIGRTEGVGRWNATAFVVGGVGPDTPLNGDGVVLTDAYAQWNGIGSGLSISGNGTDGKQELYWRNAAGVFALVDSNGTSHVGAGGLAFPSEDPHIAGAWWDNAGTLTRSTG